ncbi:hypothetical protein Tco_0720103 [Tanacetum coccineum]
MEQQMTLLCDIDPMMDDVKVLERCISIWKSHAAGKPNQPWGLDVVLQDPEYIHKPGYTTKGIVGCNQPLRVAAMTTTSATLTTSNIVGNYSFLT